MTEPPTDKPTGQQPRVDPSHPSVAGRLLVAEDAFAKALQPGRFGVADCCSAEAHFRAVLPATDQRRHEVELLLCGHHARVCRERLTGCGAQLFDEWGLPA